MISASASANVFGNNFFNLSTSAGNCDGSSILLFSIIIVVAEGALIKDYGGPITKDAKTDQFGNVMLGGIAEYISGEISKVLKVETRACVPAHTIRGGSPSALDRVISMRLGIAAVDLIKKSEFGFMTALKAGKIVKVPLSKITGKNKNINIRLFNELNVFFK